MSEPRARLLSSLRHRDYRLLLAGFTVSDIGTWAYGVALVVWVYDATGSFGWLAVTTIVRFVPALVFGSYGGVVADRFEKARLMARSDVVYAALMAVIAVLMTVQAPVLAVLATGGVLCALGTVYEPAAAGLTPLVVPERDLASANALRNTIDSLVVIAGPGIGALLLLAGPPQVAVWINAATFLVSAALISAVRVRSAAVDVTEGGEQGPLRQALVGLRVILSSPTVTVMVGYSILATLVYGVDTVLFVAVSDRLLGTGPHGYGYLLAGLGAGGVLAAPLVTRLEARPSLGPVILIGMAAYCLPTALLLVSHSAILVCLAQVVRGAGTLVVDVLAITALQRTLAHDVLARVFGAFNSLALLAVLVGSATGSWLIAWGGVPAAAWVAGPGCFALSLLGLPWLRRMDRLARRRRAELAPRIALIEGCHLFDQVPDGGLSQLASAAVRIDVPAGTTVVEQGEPADAFYVVENGTMSIHAMSPAGVQVNAPDLGSGQYFGEIGLIEGIARTATVVADTEATLLRIDGSAFLDALTSGTPSAAIMDGAALRLGRTHPTLSLRRAGLEAGVEQGGA